MFAGRRVLVIQNPTAGRGRAEAVERAVRSGLERFGAEVELRRAGASEDVQRWSAAAGDEGFERLLVAGGDGTVSAAAASIVAAGHAVPLGIVPAGTGNGLARVLRIPVDAGEALEALQCGALVQLDVMRRVDGDTMALVFFGAGLDAEIIRDADRKAKARFGFLAYLGAGAKNLWRRRNHRVRLTLDGDSETLEAHTVAILNAADLEIRGLRVGPDIDPHDGWLDVALLRDPGFWRSLGAVLRLFGGRRGAGELRRARRILIEAEPPLEVHADGEADGSTPLEVEVLPGALAAIAARSYPHLPAEPGRRRASSP
jgi:diacylglycerol kinase (ATP)